MTLDEVIIELYRLAETRKWQGRKSDEAMLLAIEGMEQIWSLRLTDKRKSMRNSAIKKQPRLWS